MIELTSETSVEELVERYPRSAGWLARRGIICVKCGEAYWGPLSDLAREKGISSGELEVILGELKEFLAQEASA